MYCPNCGLNNPDNALNCSACGAALGAQAPGAAPPVTPTAAPVAQKSKLTAGLLAIFLGTLGIHNFYLGFTTKAIIQLVVSLLGAAAFVSLPQKCSPKSKLKISAKMAVIMSNTVSHVFCVEFLNANSLIK